MSTCRPNLHKYPGQSKAQDAHIDVYPDGSMKNRWNPEIGNAVPVNVWHRIIIRFHIDNKLTQREIDALIETIKPDVLKLLEITYIENGIRVFSPEADDLHENISLTCEENCTEEFEPCDDEDCEYCYEQSESEED